MEKIFNKDWCRQTSQVLIYLESAFNNLANNNSLKVRGENWGSDPFSDEIPANNIGFEVKITRPKVRGNDLWVGIWFSEESPVKDCPIWISILRDDQSLWERLQKEFNDTVLLNTDKVEAVGLQWPLTYNASNEQVRNAGQELANRITRVLLPN